MSKEYDVVIVGAGISGLYSAYKLKRNSPTTSVLILEKNPRSRIGGRAGTEMFYGTRINIGAGIGREDKNPKLIQLCRDLGIQLDKSYTANINYSSALKSRVANPQREYLDTIKCLKSRFRADKDKARKMTFQQFATNALGSVNAYKMFVVMSGYSDYESADVYETLYNYGLDDNTGGWQQLYIPWTEIVDRLSAEVGLTNIRTSSPVSLVLQRPQGGFETFIEGVSKPILSKKVIVATTIDTVQRLIPAQIYDHIRGQPFLRVYAKFDKSSAELLRTYIQSYTVVTTGLQKIIPINQDKGVYMIAYCDNINAENLKGVSKTVFERLVEKSLGVPEKTLNIVGLKEFYWKVGTHYFSPLPKEYKNRKDFLYDAQHPMRDLMVVGEALSTYQGWTEGALESVDAVLS
jgi:hypothetical protein